MRQSYLQAMTYPQNFEEKIGFDKIRRLLSDRCLSTLGSERVADMKFQTSFDTIEQLLRETEEFTHLLQNEEDFPATIFLTSDHRYNAFALRALFSMKPSSSICAAHWRPYATSSDSFYPKKTRKASILTSHRGPVTSSFFLNY